MHPRSPIVIAAEGIAHIDCPSRDPKYAGHSASNGLSTVGQVHHQVRGERRHFPCQVPGEFLDVSAPELDRSSHRADNSSKSALFAIACIGRVTVKKGITY